MAICAKDTDEGWTISITALVRKTLLYDMRQKDGRCVGTCTDSFSKFWGLFSPYGDIRQGQDRIMKMCVMDSNAT